MNDELSPESVKALSAYRIERAKSTLAEVEKLKELGYYSTAINRMYYSCYYAATSLLVKHHLTPISHAGVKQLLGLHFVATGKISRELGRYYTILFERRHSNDYDDFVFTGIEEVNDLYPKAQELVTTIEHLLAGE